MSLALGIQNMGHDYLEYKDKNIRLNDFNIWMLRHFLIKASKDKELCDFFTKIEWHGPGVFSGTELHEFTKCNKTKVNELISTLTEAKKLIENFGDFIPLTYLQENVNLKSSYFTSQQSVKEYSENIDSLLAVIMEAENA